MPWIFNPFTGNLDFSGAGGTLGEGYNFLETVPAVDETIANETITISGKTMRHMGVDSQLPVVTINSVDIPVTQTVGDLNIFTFSASYSLAIGDNVFLLVSDNGSNVCTKTLTITRAAVAPSCSLAHALYLKAGVHTVTLTSDYDLTSTPTLDASVGSFSVFAGSGKVWNATLAIIDENGPGLFSNAVLVGDGGAGSTITSGATYTVDTVVPVIGTANFSATLWYYETGAMTCTVAMGEATTGFTGQIDFSAFGLSTLYALLPSGNNMVATFTPARADAGPAYGTNIRVSDRAGNPAAPKANTDNQLQVVAYRLALQNLTFPAYLAASNALTGGKVVVADANSHVSWGADQTNVGVLVYSTDYVLDDHNKVHLDETKWADTIAANALGLLNVNIYED